MAEFDIGREDEPAADLDVDVVESALLLAGMRTGIDSHTSSRLREPPAATPPSTLAISGCRNVVSNPTISLECLPVHNSRMSARRLMAASSVPGNLTWRLRLVFS